MCGASSIRNKTMLSFRDLTVECENFLANTSNKQGTMQDLCSASISVVAEFIFVHVNMHKQKGDGFGVFVA